jgi:hypothetical protein
MRFASGFFWVCLGTAFLFVTPDKPRFDLVDSWKISKIRIAFFYFWGLCIIGSIGHVVLSSKWDFFSIGRAQSHPVKEYTVAADPPFSVWIAVEGPSGNSPLPSTPFRQQTLKCVNPVIWERASGQSDANSNG